MADDPTPLPGPLTGVRILDLADELAAYASRLLGDLGADVIRVEPPGGSPMRAMAPLLPTRDGVGASAFDRFVNAGKRSIELDLDAPEGIGLFFRLLERSDVLIETMPRDVADARGLSPAAVAERLPRLIHVSVTPYGHDRPVQEAADDLTILAAGGLLHLGGYHDAEPVAAYGGQSGYAASLFAAVAASISLLDRERTGRGGWVDVSAQGCVAQALEDSVATFDLTGTVRRRLGDEPREAGTGIYACADGYLSMVAGRLGTARAWRALVAWLVEVGTPGAEELQDPRWSEHPFRQTEQATARFGEIFARFAEIRTRDELYHEAQARGIALSPVNDIAAVLADPQLRAREFFTTVDDPMLARSATFPGPPYRLSRTPARRARPAPALGAHGREVWVDDMGLDPGEYQALVEAGIA